ncbi:MAG: nitrogenase component 1 [Acidaminococcaceae bacterium]|nr:nitrogenase component 1 [Acidaminococcaceae bacterium]
MPGVWRAVAYTDGVVVIFHSPRACAHIARTMDINTHYRSLGEGRQEERASVPLLSSQLEEKHSIFGGVDRLRKCIAFAIEKYQPKCLVLGNSCVAGVIGDDVESVAKEVEEEYGLPVLTVDSYGFLDGEYYEGYFEITYKLIDRFLQPQEHVPKTVVLLGDSGGPWGHYATEATRLLQAMGVKVIGQFPGYMTLEDLPRLTSAEAMVVLGGRGQTHDDFNKLTKILEERFGLKSLPGIYPVGWQQTERWLVEIGKLLNCEAQACEVLTKERLALQKSLQQFLPVTKNKKTVLCIGRWLMYFHPDAVLGTIKNLELDLTGIILLDAYEEEYRQEMVAALRLHTDVSVYTNIDGEALLKEADLVLTTHELQDKNVKQIFLPMLPKVGTNGEIEFMQAIYRVLCSRHGGGGMIYV